MWTEQSRHVMAITVMKMIGGGDLELIIIVLLIAMLMMIALTVGMMILM
jgi:hypothetical protein